MKNMMTKLEALAGQPSETTQPKAAGIKLNKAMALLLAMIGFAPKAQAIIDYTNVPYVSTDCEWETQYNPFAAPTTMAHWMSTLVHHTCWTNYEGGFIVHQNGVVRENGFRTHWRCAGTWFLTTNHFDVVNMPDGNMKESPLLCNNVEDRNFKLYSAAPENDTCLARIQQAAEAKLDGAGTDDTVGANLTIALCKLLRPHEARGPNHDGPHAYVVSNLFRYAKTPYREDPAGFCSGARLDYHSFNRVDPIINFHYTPISKNAETDPNVAPSAFLKAIYNQYGPGIKNCIETLDLVPDNWTGTYLLHNRDYGKQTVQEMTRFYEYDSTTPIMTNRTRVVTHPDAWPALDEDVYVDRGDVLVMKSLCYMVDSAFQMMQAYDLPGKKSGKWADNVCTNLTVVQESMHGLGYTHHGQANTNIIYRVGFSERIDQIIHDAYHEIPELLTNIVDNAALALAREEYLKSLECLLDADAFINGKATSVTGKSIVGARDPSQLHLIDFAEAESEDEGGEWNFAGWREFAEKTYASLKGKDTESAVQTLDLKDLGKKLDIHAGSMGNATDAQHGLVNFDGIGPDKDGKIKFDMNAFFDGKITRNDVILDGSLFQTNGPSRTVMTRWMITPDGAKSVYYNEWLIEQYPEYVKNPTAWMAKYPDVQEYMIKGSGARKHLYLYKSINRLHLTIGPKTLHSTLCGLYPSGTLFDDLLTMKTRYPANSETYRSGFSEMVDVYNCERAVLEDGTATNLVAGIYTAAPTSESGGAFFLYPNATLTGTNVTFAGNESTTYGGAIYALPSCIIKLVDAVFENNKSCRGGAIYNSSGADLTLENVTFRGNSPTANGGAIANTPGGTVNFDGTVTLATETDTISNTRELASGTLNWNLSNGKHGLLNGYQNINNNGTLKITVDDAIVVPTNIVIATGNFTKTNANNTCQFAIAYAGSSLTNLVIDSGEKVLLGSRFYQLSTEADLSVPTTNLVLTVTLPHPIPFPLESPEWEPMPMGDAMVVYAVVSNRHEKTKVEAAGSLLAAFSEDGECRGVATIEDGPGGSLLFQLIVGYADADETFLLKVWDASAGEIVELPMRIFVSEEGVIGTLKTPIVLGYGTAEVSLTLKEGWNWISPILNPEAPCVGDVLSGVTFADEDMIKSAGKVATYYDGLWYPANFKLEAGAAYMVHKGTSGETAVTVEGLPAESNVTVNIGWNWIGTTLLTTQTVSRVAHSAGFGENDIIHSASKSTTFSDGAWYSSAFELIPGVGYKAKFANAGTLTFGEIPVPNAPVSLLLCAAPKTAMTAAQQQVGVFAKPTWEPVAQKDTLVAYLQISNNYSRTLFESRGSTLAAFASDGECRGAVEVDQGPAGELYQLPIGVKSSTESGFKLKLWDSASASLYDIGGTIDGNTSGVVGKIVRPVVLTADVLSGDPIPEIAEPTKDLVETVMARATDVKLAAAITNESQYADFSAWAGSAKTHDGSKLAGAVSVMAAPNAWVSFALGSDKLLLEPPTDEDLTVEQFEPSSEAGKFDFTVSVEGVEVGSEAQKENLKQVFGLEGAASLDSDAFSSGNVDLTFDTPENGKVKFTAGPKDTNTSTFFMKVKVNP